MRFASFIHSIFSYDIFRIGTKRQQCHAYVVVCLCCQCVVRSFMCRAVCIVVLCASQFSVLNSQHSLVRALNVRQIRQHYRYVWVSYSISSIRYSVFGIRVLCTNVPFLNTEYMHSIASCCFSVFSLGSTIWQPATGNSSYFIFV